MLVHLYHYQYIVIITCISLIFFGSDKGLASVYLQDYPQYVQRLILLSAAHGSQSASLELLLSSHHFTCTHDSMLPAVKHQLPAGPMCPSSHDLPWLSKPLVHLIYSSTADQHHHKPQGIHPHPHRPCVTLASPLRNARTTYKTQLSPSHRVHVTLVSPPMTDAANQ